MYVVLSGCLGVYLAPTGDRRRFVGASSRATPSARWGSISGRPRSGTVVALRDTELARLVAGGLRPRISPASRSDAAHRADSPSTGSSRVQTRGRARPPGARTFAILPQCIDVDAAGFASELVKALGAIRARRACVERARRGAYQPLVQRHRERRTTSSCTSAEPSANSWTQPVRAAGRCADAAGARRHTPGDGRRLPAQRDTHRAAARGARACCTMNRDHARRRRAMARAQPGIPHHHVTGRQGRRANRAAPYGPGDRRRVLGRRRARVRAHRHRQGAARGRHSGRHRRRHEHGRDHGRRCRARMEHRRDDRSASALLRGRKSAPRLHAAHFLADLRVAKSVHSCTESSAT